MLASDSKSFAFTEGVRSYVGKTKNNVTISNKGTQITPSSYAAGTYYRRDWVTNIGLINGYTKSGMVVMNVLSGNPYTWSGTLGDDNIDKYNDLNTNIDFWDNQG